jgi:hypothetical protein
MGQWSGGCACGAIRYACEGEPTLMLNCHCRDCQRASGSAYAAIAIFPKTAVALAGEPRWVKATGRSGHPVERGFCADCGSPIAIKLGMAPNLFGVQAASLDEPARFKPKYDIFTSSAHPWDAMDPKRPKKPLGMRD